MKEAELMALIQMKGTSADSDLDRGSEYDDGESILDQDGTAGNNRNENVTVNKFALSLLVCCYRPLLELLEQSER